VNDRYCSLLGYTEDELRKKTLDEITHPGDREAATLGRQLLLSEEVSSHTMEKRYIRKDQSIAWARLYRSLVRDSENRPLYFIAVVEDITDKVSADRARRESEERLRIAQSAARLAVWDRDLRSNMISASGDYDGLFGLAPGHPPLTFEDWLVLIHPEDRDQVRARIRDTIERRHVMDMEFRVVWPDGSIHWLLAKGKVLVDEAGQPFRIAGVNLDITGRKLAEAALRESEDRFRKIADTAPVMIWLSGPDKGLMFFNKVWLDFTGRTLQQEVGQGWTVNIHPDDYDRCIAEYSSHFDSRRNFHLEYRLRRADGEYRWMLCSGVPRYVDGAFAGYIGSDIDITYVKRAQEEALVRQKLESMGLLASGVAHDFNNLLGGILASVELALTESSGIQPIEEELTRVKAASIRGAELVRQLMIYSGKESPEFKIADISVLVAEMLDLLKASISKHAVLNTHLGRDLPAVRASLAQIRQVIMNLVINASEAIGEQEGEIQISTSRVTITPQSSTGFGAEMDLPPDDYVRLEVSDTGVGMTPEVQAKIFDPFFSTKFAGRGLGLAVTQGIVRRHRGAITARPRDHGTTFEVLLPCTQEPAQQTSIAVSNSTEPAMPPVGTVLIVEDEEFLRTALLKSLRKRGFSVIEAVDGSAAIDLVSTERSISTVLLDATLPGLLSRHVFDSMKCLRPDL
jgi:PAS domain S-box-containing protein